jgi:hypothetical protein
MWLKAQPGAGQSTDADVDTGDGDARPGRKLLCCRCLTPITSEDARSEIDGSHEHYGANLHGYRFRYGCFSNASGCVLVGQPSRHWSWHNGYSWQIENCSGCAVHLGWRFSGEAGTFHGLILERLCPEDE